MLNVDKQVERSGECGKLCWLFGS